MKNNYKKIMYIALIVAILLLGGTYAFFTYFREGEQINRFITGEVSLYYKDGTNSINLTDALPESYEKAKTKTDNYITFTVEGTNTTENKDLYYEIVLNYGNDVSGRTRLEDEDLRFELTEIIDGVPNIVLSDVSYQELNGTKIWVNNIPDKTETNTVRTYQLRMWISDEVVISNTLDSADYITTEFANSYASVKVVVNGDFEEKEADDYLKDLYDTVETELASYLLADDGDARIVSGGGGYNGGSPVEDANFKNYVWYSGKLWRIVALNNDGSIKLVTQDNITTISWGSNGTYKGSWIYQWLNEDFKDTLYNYQNLLVTNYQWNATQTSASTKPANTTMVEGAVGLLNYYEYVQSYSKLGTDSTAYGVGYLNNGYWWWLITPCSSWSVWRVGDLGGASYYTDPAATLFFGVRPSINLKSNIKTAKGDGSKTNPYTIVGDISSPPTNELISERVSGEYVTFDNELYRIVNIENNITKITKTDCIRYFSGTVVTKSLSSTITYGASGNTKNDDYWDYYLNNTWYNNISTNYKNMIVSGTWYLGTVSEVDEGVSNNYKNAICATINTTETTKLCTRTSTVYNGYVGLGRIGEMFTSQIGEGYGTSSDIWTITPYSSLDVRYVYNGGSAGELNPALERFGARPSVNLKSTIKITGGKGTKESPFVISE